MHSLHSSCFSLIAVILRSVLAVEHVVIIDRRQTVTPEVDDILRRIDLHSDHHNVSNIWNNSAFSGFSATIRPKHIGCLQNMSDVLVVERSINIAHAGVIRRDQSAVTTRPRATWGLSRISTAFFTAGETQSLDYDYMFDGNSPGQRADIYVLDSGIWTAHNGFGGRAKMIYSFDGNNTDTDGHGTHVAGTVGAIDFGVASNANIYGIRVIDAKGGGSSITLIAGLDYAITQHNNRKQNSTDFVGSIIHMSLAAVGQVAALDQAVAAAVNAGIHVSVAAGNNASDACSNSPSSSGGSNGVAITVGSVNIQGQRSSFSDYGSCVDVYAPGEEVLSCGLNNPDLLVSMSGTSMAAPHVSGLIAYAMSRNQTLADSPALMKQWLQSTGLPLGDGTLLANNGANSDTSGGIIGAEVSSVAGRSSFIAAGSDHTGPSKRDRLGTAPRRWSISDSPNVVSS